MSKKWKDIAKDEMKELDDFLTIIKQCVDDRNLEELRDYFKYFAERFNQMMSRTPEPTIDVGAGERRVVRVKGHVDEHSVRDIQSHAESTRRSIIKYISEHGMFEEFKEAIQQ